MEGKTAAEIRAAMDQGGEELIRSMAGWPIGKAMVEIESRAFYVDMIDHWDDEDRRESERLGAARRYLEALRAEGREAVE